MNRKLSESQMKRIKLITPILILSEPRMARISRILTPQGSNVNSRGF